MILFSDIIEQLESSELSLVRYTDPKTGVFEPKFYNHVIGWLNTALSDIYIKFIISHGSCVIKTAPGKYNYELIKANALTESPTGFIIDSIDAPFEDDVLEIIGAETLHGRELRFNVNGSTLSNSHYDINHESSFSLERCELPFMSPKYKVFRTPLGLEESLIRIKYKAGHKRIPNIADPITFDKDSLVIQVPYAFLMAIVYFITSRALNAKGTERAGQGLFNEGSSFYAKYASEVKNLKDNMNNLQQTDEQIDVFSLRGFV